MSKKVFGFFLFCLTALIPFQPRFYKVLKPFSRSLVQPIWNFPSYFEIHCDLFVADIFLLGLLFMGIYKISSWKSLFWEGEKKYLTLFLFASLLSIFHSSLPFYPLHYWRWLHLALPVALFLVASHSIPISFRKLATVVVAAVFLEAGIAIAQYFVQHSLGLKLLGEPTLITRSFLGSSVPMGDGSVWIFDRLFHVIRDRSFILRASGTLPHPNILGGILVFGLCMSYYLYRQNSQRRVLLGGVIGIQILALFITYSRSALYMWIAVTSLWILVISLNEKKFTSLSWVVSGFFLLGIGIFYPQLFERGGIVSYTAVSQVSDAQRLTLHDIGWSMIKTHPWLGVGFNSYMLAFQPLFEQQASVDYLHNVYLQLASEVGIPGVVFFLIFCALILKEGWKMRRSPEVLACLCIFVAFLGIGLVDHYPLCDFSSKLVFFLTAGLMKAQIATPGDV
jgi:hypothetical protein